MLRLEHADLSFDLYEYESHIQNPTLRRFLPITNHPGRRQEGYRAIKACHDYYAYNTEFAKPDFPKPCQNLIGYLYLHSDTDRFPGRQPMQPAFRDEEGLFCTLKWYVTKDKTLQQFAKARKDIKLGSNDIMDTIYDIAKV